MIYSGRNRKSGESSAGENAGGYLDQPDKSRRMSGLTAFLGTLVFAVFICLSVDQKPPAEALNDGAYQVFAPAEDSEKDSDTEITTDTDNFKKPENVMADGGDSVWYYLEAAIARLIFGSQGRDCFYPVFRSFFFFRLHFCPGTAEDILQYLRQL